MGSFKKLSTGEARACVSTINAMSEDDFGALVKKWRSHTVDDVDHRYLALRKSLVEGFSLAGGDDPSIRTLYPVDVEVGLRLFEGTRRSGGCGLSMGLVDAADDDVWRYLSIKVCPDLTYMRYPSPDKKAAEAGERINSKRFYSHTRRIWLKSLWWYVYLAWQGDSESTRAVIKDNGANIISHFIETPGKGYRVDLYRAFMKTYSEQRTKSDALFRAAAKLNGAKCRTMEPELYLGGVRAFSQELFDEVSAGAVAKKG